VAVLDHPDLRRAVKEEQLFLENVVLCKSPEEALELTYEGGE
jgi:hypothetical protein